MDAPKNRTEIRVYFEDTDFTGRVYHGAFVRYLERARTECLRARGVDHRQLASGKRPVFFTIRGLDMRFHGPAQIDDLLVVESEPGGSRAILTFRQRVLREDQLIVSADVELCMIDGAGRPVRPPPEVLALMRGS